MLASRNYSGYGVTKNLFSDVRFVLFGFDSVSEAQYQSELVRRGGISVGRYDASCTHVIVSGRVYDDPICVAARNDGKTVVTESWIDDSVDFGTLEDASRVIYRPVKDLNGIPGCESLCICLTGYQRQDRDYIMKMVALMGARFSKPLIASQVTHLICYKFEGDKYELAKKVNIKLVNHEWLEDSLKAWEVLPSDNYARSSRELEMLESKAMDSEEEADNGGMRAVEQRSIAGASNIQTGMPTTKPLDVANQTMELSSIRQNCVEVTKLQDIEDRLRNNKSDYTPAMGPGTGKGPNVCKLDEQVFGGLDLSDPGVLAGECDQYAARDGIGCGYETVSHGASSKSERKTLSSPRTTKRGSPCSGIADETLTTPSHTRKTTRRSISPEKPSNDMHLSPHKNVEGHLSKGGSDGAPLALKQARGNLESAGIPSLKSSSSIHHIKRNVVSDPIAQQSTTPSKAQSLSYKKHLSRHPALRDQRLRTTGASLDGKVAESAGNVEPREASGESFETTSNMPISETKSTGAILSPKYGKEMKDLPLEEPQMLVDMQTSVGNTANNLDRLAIGSKVRDKTSLMKASEIPSSEMALIGSGASGKCEWTGRSENNSVALDNLQDVMKEAGIPSMPDQDERVLPADGGDSNSKRALDTARSDTRIANITRSAFGAQIKKAVAKRGLGRWSKQSSGKCGKDIISHEAGTPDKAAIKLGKVKVEPASENKPRKDKDQTVELLAEDTVMEDIVSEQEHPSRHGTRNTAVDRMEICINPEKENKPTGNSMETKSNSRKAIDKGNREATETASRAGIDGATEMEMGSSLGIASTEQASFILSGRSHQKKELRAIIRRLKGRLCRVSHNWSHHATHLIAPDPVRRTEKFFAAAAAGRWILKTDYLAACSEAGKFIKEEAFEWCKKGLSEDGAINLEAPRKWRLSRKRTGHGAFYGLNLIVYGECIAPTLDTIKRAVKAGDGNILATSPPYTRILKSGGVDFAIISPTIPRVDPWVREFLRNEIPCVTPDYLVEFVCKPGYSLDKHVLYKTHAWAEKSFSNLLSRLDESVGDASYSSEESIDDLSCVVCGSHDREDVMLICGDEEGSVGCGIGTHIDCCNPPLKTVPEEDWFCPDCRGSGVGSPL